MRFLCKKCGAQSPGDISEVEIRDGALVFTCRACGASATLVENRASRGTARSADGPPVEKGIVEPDEEELVDLGEATLSRMLGKKVRILAEESEPVAPPPVVEPAPAAGPEERPLPAFLAETSEAPRRRRRSRLFLAVAASVGLVAVATVALLEARPQRTPSGRGAAALGQPAPESAGAPPLDAAAEPPTGAGRPQAAPGVVPASPNAPSAPARADDVAEDPARRIELKELATPPPAAAVEPVGAGLVSEHVDEAFFRVRPAVRMCAAQERRRHPDAPLGSEAVVLTVEPSGEVTGVEFERHDLAETPLGACLTTELRKVRVEAFAGPAAVVRRVLDLSRPGASPN